MDTKIQIMIVEDDEALANEISSYLVKWGYEIVMAKQFDDIVMEYQRSQV